MNVDTMRVARSVIHRIYLLLALTAVGGLLAFYVAPPALLERGRVEKRFAARQQQIRDGLNDIERLALATHLGEMRTPGDPARVVPSDLIGELAVNSRRAVEAKIAQVTALVEGEAAPAASLLTQRLTKRMDAFLEEPASTSALESVLLVIEQLRQASVRAGELHDEEESSSLLSNERFVTGLLLALLAYLVWAGIRIVRSSRFTVRSLAETIAQRDEQAQALQRERDFAASLTETAPAIILILDPTGAVVHVNPFFEQLSGWRREEIAGKDWFAAFAPEREREAIRALFLPATEAAPVRGHVNTIVTRRGEEREIEWHSEPQHDAAGRVTRVLAVGVDVTERNRADAAVRRALHEKETLLREIHHRVKNNLQIISSLLHFQAKKAHDAQAAAVFAEARERLRSMILVHEKLYNSRDLSKVEFADYVCMLVDQFAHSTDAGQRINFKVETAPIMLPIEAALPCGMILVELLTNVVKYAFPDGRAGDAFVRLAADGDRVSLTVGDSGVGLPPDFDPAAARSFGWQLIRNLTTQLDGSTEIVRKGGTCVTLSFCHSSGSSLP